MAGPPREERSCPWFGGLGHSRPLVLRKWTNVRSRWAIIGKWSQYRKVVGRALIKNNRRGKSHTPEGTRGINKETANKEGWGRGGGGGGPVRDQYRVSGVPCEKGEGKGQQELLAN